MNCTQQLRVLQKQLSEAYQLIEELKTIINVQECMIQYAQDSKKLFIRIVEDSKLITVEPHAPVPPDEIRWNGKACCEL